MSHRSRIAALAVLLALAAPAFARGADEKLTPSQTVKAFYTLLHNQQYVQGFSLSVFADAVVGLSPDELAELAPDFEETAGEIPDQITISDEKITGDTATVVANFGDGNLQTVGLVKEDGRWLVGDRDSLKVVRKEKTSFFFNTRIEANQNSTYRVLKALRDAEDSYFQQTGTPGALDDLVTAKLLPEEFKGGLVAGYKYTITPNRGADATISAVPARYGRTGKLSFYADVKGIHAADHAGAPADATAPKLNEVQQPAPPPK